MAYSAEIIADSISPDDYRLTTMEVNIPRIVLAELNTPRLFSRNSASSRAKPIPEQLEKVVIDMFIPEEFGRNKKGMSPDYDKPFSDQEKAAGRQIWIEAGHLAVEKSLELSLGKYAMREACIAVIGVELSDVTELDKAEALLKVIRSMPRTVDQITEFAERIGVSESEILNTHKQYSNRLVEPFMWHTVVLSATEWSNFYALRIHPDAQTEICRAAESMRDAQNESKPKELDYSEWHLPYIYADEAALSIDVLKKMSASRCAAVSYERQKVAKAIEAEVDRYERLISGGHMSPLEHVARPLAPAELAKSEWDANFRGWHQLRKDIPYEADYSLYLANAGVMDK